MAGEPQLTTLNSLFQQVPGGLLGLDMSDPANAMLGKILTDWLKQNVVQPLTGLSPTDPIWGATLYTNMTDFGVMMQGMNTAANQRGLQNMMQLQASSRYQFLENWQRTATPRERFANMSPEERGGFSNYEAFIQHKTQGMMDNQILTFLMQSGMWDPTGKMMASAYVREASANTAREAMWRGQRNFLEQADAVGKVFLDDQYKLDYNKRDYGLMTMNESAAVLAAMTRNKGLMDFAPDLKIDGMDNTAQMKSATEALRNRLKGLTTAMSPLKDFFGDDIPKMIQFLEDLSGKAFNEISTTEIANLTQRATTSLATGQYTREQIQAVTKTLTNSLGQINAPFYVDAAANGIAETLLTTVNAGLTPTLMSGASFRSAVSEQTIRHATSPFANSINLAYSNWRWNREEAARKENRKITEDEISIDTFQRDYINLIQSGKYSPERAMLTLSGAPSVQQMANTGYAHSGYEIAATQGLGARLADREALRTRMIMATASRPTKEQQEAWMGVYELFTDVNKRDGLTAQGMRDRIRGWEHSTNQRERAMYEAYMTISTNKMWEPLMVDLMTQAAKVDADVKNKNAADIKRRTDFVGTLFGDLTNASNANELLWKTLLGDKEASADLEKSVEALRGRASLDQITQSVGATEDDIASIQTILKASGLAVSKNMSAEDKGIMRKRLETVQSYMLDIANGGKKKAEALKPYVQAAQAVFDVEEAELKDTSKIEDEEQRRNAEAKNREILMMREQYASTGEARIAKETLRYASMMTTDALELFAEEDKAMGRESGESLRNFIAITKQKHDKLKEARQYVKMANDMAPEQRNALLRTAMTDLAAGRKVGIAAAIAPYMEELAPNWQKQWEAAVAADEKAGDSKKTEEFLNAGYHMLTKYVSQDERQFLFRELRDYSAYQNFRFGPQKGLFQEKAKGALDVMQDTVKAHHLSEKLDEQMTARTEAAHKDFMENVLSGKKNYGDWMEEHFKDYSKWEKNDLTVMYGGLLRAAGENAPQNLEAISQYSLEEMMTTAFDSGAVFTELSNGINKLTSILGQLPEFMSGVASSLGFNLKPSEPAGN